MKEERYVGWVTTACATGFLFAIAWKFAPGDYLGAVWLLLGAVLFELGLRGVPDHFRWSSYFVSAAGLWSTFWHHVVDAQIGSSPSEVVSFGIATAVCSAMSVRLFHSEPTHIDDQERELCRDLYAASGAMFAMALAWLRLPPQIVAPVWTVISVALFEIGVRMAFPRFRLVAHVIAGAVCLRLIGLDLNGFDDALHITWRTITVLPIVSSQYYVWARHRTEGVSDLERWASRFYLYAAAILTVVLARIELGSTAVSVAWALFALALSEVGRRRDITDVRWQGYVVALLSFHSTIVMLAASNPRHVLAGSAVVVTFYCAQLFAPRGAQQGAERYTRAFYSLMASLLAAILLFHKVSGGLLTTAWAVEGLALLGAGFPLRDRLQRLSGLGLFLLCVLKLFFYDLRELETVSRILSFIVLGLILVGVSWMYTRFRDRIQRYL